ncbi:phage holin family protein [Paenibacillus terrae]|uniref:phage holin family protein n=1 Tax=Paenibacillus terrae TaxID=159743 RepID=UPI00207B3AAD|nr:phage holin family protein [Paenibacillus terrae]
MMAIDYIFGVLGAVKTKSVNSDVMFWGGIRKITVLFVVGLAAQLDDWGYSQALQYFAQRHLLLCREGGAVRG